MFRQIYNWSSETRIFRHLNHLIIEVQFTQTVSYGILIYKKTLRYLMEFLLYGKRFKTLICFKQNWIFLKCLSRNKFYSCFWHYFCWWSCSHTTIKTCACSHTMLKSRNIYSCFLHDNSMGMFTHYVYSLYRYCIYIIVLEDCKMQRNYLHEIYPIYRFLPLKYTEVSCSFLA